MGGGLGGGSIDGCEQKEKQERRHREEEECIENISERKSMGGIGGNVRTIFGKRVGVSGNRV